LSTVAQIMDEMAAVLEDACPSLNQVTARMNFKPTVPSIDIYPADPFRTDEGAGFSDINGAMVFTVRARATTADNEAGQDILLTLMDDESTECVAFALMDDQSLNGTVAWVDVDGPSGFTQFVDPSTEGSYLGVTWTVSVLNIIT
jgi:hypothetical protein